MHSIELWSRPPFQVEEAAPGTGTCIAIHWSRSVPGWQFAHQLRFDPMQTSVDPRGVLTVALARFVCHMLVDEVPERGLGELYESLSGMYKFYVDQAEKPRAALPSVRRIDATVGRSMERPAFGLESDEG